MPRITKRPPSQHFLRCLRLYLSDFLHLFTPDVKKVYSWNVIFFTFLIFFATSKVKSFRNWQILTKEKHGGWSNPREITII
jgi:hypothetical protein